MNGSIENSTTLNSAEAKCIPFTMENRVCTKAIKATCYTVLMLLSLLGNAAVIAIVAKNRHMRTTTNDLIANMAASDLLLSTFAVPREIAEIFIGFRGWLIDWSSWCNLLQSFLLLPRHLHCSLHTKYCCYHIG